MQLQQRFGEVGEVLGPVVTGYVSARMSSHEVIEEACFMRWVQKL